MNLRLDIQGLRALAVLLVIIFHINEKWLPGGFIGVDVFFVISGFLISKSIIDQTDKKQFNFIRFFEGRIKRIAPAYYVMLLCVLAMAIFLYPANYFDPFIGQFRNTALFLSNRVFSLGLDYFGPSNSEVVLLHTWSLGIEMQFYIIMPLLIYFSPKKWRLLILSGLSLLLLIYTEYHLRILGNKSAMYFSLPARSVEFLIGILINFLPSSQSVRKFAMPLAVFAFSIIIFSAFYLDSNSVFPGLSALPACLGTACLIWIKGSPVNRALALEPAVAVGNWSYSLYLWHWPVLSFYRFIYQENEIPAVAIIVLVLIFSALALISYYAIEAPSRKVSRGTLYYGFSVVMVVTLGFYLLSIPLNEKAVPIPRSYIKPVELSNHHRYDGYRLYGDTSIADQHVFVVGDSHAHSLRPFFAKVAKEHHFNFSTVSMNSYPPLPGYAPEEMINNPTFDAEVYNELLPIVLERIKASKVIVLARVWEHTYDMDRQLQLLLKEMRPDQSLILLSDFATLDSNPVRTYRSFRKPDDFSPPVLKKPVKSRAIDELLKGNGSSFHYFDLYAAEFYKTAPYYKDTLMYYDTGHLNFYGAESLADFKGEQFAKLVKTLLRKE